MRTLLVILVLSFLVAVSTVLSQTYSQKKKEAAPHAATREASPASSATPTREDARSQHSVENASREELLKIVEKQNKLINALQARVKELEQGVKSDESLSSGHK